MFEVRCQECQSPFEVDERRVPRSGMQMRCPKCNASFLVKRPAGAAPPPPPVPSPTVETTKRGTLAFSAGVAAEAARTGNTSLPVVKQNTALPAVKEVSALPAPKGTGTALLTSKDLGAALPMPKDLGVGLPAPREPGAGLPAPKDLGVGLPTPMAPSAALPMPKDLGAGLPMPKDLSFGAPPRNDSGMTSAVLFDFDLDDEPSKAPLADRPLAMAPSADLPVATDFGVDLPVARAPGADLPVVSDFNAALPAVRDFDLDLPSPSDTDAPLPAVRDFADPPDASAMIQPLPTGAGYPGATKLPGTPRSTMALDPSRIPGMKSATPRGLPTDLMPEVLEQDDDDEAKLPLAQEELTSFDLPSSSDNLPSSVDLPMSAEALPAPTPDLANFGPEVPGLEPEPLPPVVTSPSMALPKEGAKQLGRIGLERKAFTVSNLDDLPAPSTNAAALPVVTGRVRRRGSEELDPEQVVRRRAARPMSSAPPTRDTFETTPELPELTPPLLSDPPPPTPGAGFGELDLGPMSVDDAPPSFGFVHPTDAPQAIPASSLPPLDNPFDPSMQSDLPPPATSMEPAPIADDLLGSFETPGSSLVPPDTISEFEPTTKPAETEKVGRFGPKKPAAPDLPAPSRFSRIKLTWVLYGTLGLCAVVIIGGAALALTPYGAFGKNWIDEALHGDERLTAANRVIQEVERTLDKDTYERALGGLRRLDQAIARVPQVKGLQAYLVYANNLVVTRFGPDPSRIGRARQLLATLADAPPGTPYLNLARASDTLMRGNAAEALRMARRDPAGRDLATLAAERLGDQEQWLRLAREGRQRHASPRSRYLLARAAWARGDHETARRETEEVLRTEARHAGARVLLARLLTRFEGERDRALDLLHDLVGGRGTASANPSGASVNERAEACVVAGQVEFLRDHVTAAQARFQRALELDPRSASALVGIGQILYRQGNYSDAQARFRNAYSADRNNLDAVIGIAQASLALGQAADARQVIEPAVHDNANDGRLHFWLGKALAATTDQRMLAQQSFREAIRLQPENLDAYVALSEMLLAMQRPDVADQVLLEARARVPENSAIHRALAHGRLARGDLTGAEGELRIALQRDPRDIRAHFALGDVLRRMQRLDDAQREFEAVAEMDAAYPGLAMARGQLAEARGELPQALQTFREALARDPTNAELIVRVAATLVSLGNFGDADQMLRSVVVDQPTNADAQYTMGRARLGSDNFVDAVHYLDRAIELNPQRADYKAYAAEAHRRAGDIQRALQLAEQSIELDATFPRGYWVRADIRLNRGDAQEALTDINRATQLDPRFWSAYATWADIDDALGRRSESIRLYRFAIDHDNRHGDWHYNLGRLLADGGDEGAAREAFQQARALGSGLVPVPSWYVQATRALADIERERHNRSEAQRLYTEYLRYVPSGSAAYNSAALALTDMLRE